MAEQNEGARYGRFLRDLFVLYGCVFAAGCGVVLIGATIYTYPLVSAGFAAGTVAVTVAAFALHLFRDDLVEVVSGTVQALGGAFGSSLARY